MVLVLVLLFLSWSWSWSCYFGLGLKNLVLFTSLVTVTRGSVTKTMDLCDLVKVAPVPQKSPTLDLVKSKLFDYAVRGVKR